MLLNRLLNHQAFDFSGVSSVVMDEFHSFNDPERGVVWELTLGLLPPHVRTLLLSATVGNSQEFRTWLHRAHGRRLELVEAGERKVPLEFFWVPDQFLDSAEQLGADLIVMGTRGLTGLKHVVLGSVAERTIRQAPCPVLTVHVPDED